MSYSLRWTRSHPERRLALEAWTEDDVLNHMADIGMPSGHSTDTEAHLQDWTGLRSCHPQEAVWTGAYPYWGRR